MEQDCRILHSLAYIESCGEADVCKDLRKGMKTKTTFKVTDDRPRNRRRQKCEVGEARQRLCLRAGGVKEGQEVAETTKAEGTAKD